MLPQIMLLILGMADPAPLPPDSWEAPMTPAKQPYRMSTQGRTWLRNAEGCKLQAYQDSRGIWTIGVGHTGKVGDVAVGPGMSITLDRCDHLLADDLHDAESAVQLAAKERAVHPATSTPAQPQIDALVSFVFNIGMAAFAQSAVRREFAAGSDAEVPAALLQWTRAGADAMALAPRRAREALMFSRGFYLDNTWKVIQ